MSEARRTPETRDVWPAWLLGFAAALVVFLALTLLVLGAVFDARPRWPAPGAADRPNAASPALQAQPREDLDAYRRRKQAELETLGWQDRAAGIARIPIEDAMRIVAERGLPDWRGEAQARQAGECGLLLDAVPRAPQAEACRQAGSGGEAGR
jgi:hypothetical protein